VSLSTAESAASKAYFVWRHSHPSEAELLDDVPPDVVSSLWAAAWKAGSWDAIKRNGALGLNLSQVIQRLEELYQLYADDQVQRTLSDELEQASVYWRGEATT